MRSKVADKLAQMRRDGTLCDVTLQAQPEGVDEPADETQPVRAHRAVLAAASTYFLDRFTNSVDSMNPVIKIQERMQHLTELMQHVRLPLLPVDVLTARARAEPLINAEQRVLQQLLGAVAFHVQSETKRTQLATGSSWYRPRTIGETVIGELNAAFTSLNTSTFPALVVVSTQANGDREIQVCEIPTGPWKTVTKVPNGHLAAGMAYFGGHLYFIGGSKDTYGLNHLQSVDVYHLAKGLWISGPNLIHRRTNLAAAELNGVLYAVGGIVNGGAYSSSVEALDPREGRWRAVASMSEKRQSHGVAALGGMMYAVGGYNADGALSSVERYIPAANKWEQVTSMSETRAGVKVTVVNDTLYAVGGAKITHKHLMERLNDSVWEPVPMPTSYIGINAMATHDGRLYAMVHKNFSDCSILVYDPETDTWSDLSPTVPNVITTSRLQAAIVVDWPGNSLKDI